MGTGPQLTWDLPGEEGRRGGGGRGERRAKMSGEIKSGDREGKGQDERRTEGRGGGREGGSSSRGSVLMGRSG